MGSGKSAGLLVSGMRSRSSPSLVMMNLRLPNQIWEPGVRLTLPLATGDMFVGWRQDDVAIPDPADMVSRDTQMPPTWHANCRCKK
jgi:hypothetical protein